MSSDAYEIVVLGPRRVVYKAGVMADDEISQKDVAREALLNRDVIRKNGHWAEAYVFAAEEQKNSDILRVDPVGEHLEDFARVMGWIA